MDGLQHLTSLRSLWLGKNKIEHVSCVSQMSQLAQLDVQNNRLTSLEGMQDLPRLEELYLAHNRIETLEHLPRPTAGATLKTVDLSSNGVRSLAGAEHQSVLEELWMSSSSISLYDELQPLLALEHFTCIYLEHSPIAADFEYRMRLTKMFPTLLQLDAVPVSQANVVRQNNLGSNSTAAWNAPPPASAPASILKSSSNFTLPNKDLEGSSSASPSVAKKGGEDGK